MLTGLIFPLLSLAILALPCLKGREHLSTTEGWVSSLFRDQSQDTDQSPEDSSHCRNTAVSLLPSLADQDQEVKLL